MKFELKVMSATEDISSMMIDAISEEDAKQQAKLKGFVLLSIKQKSATGLRMRKPKSGFQLVLLALNQYSLFRRIYAN
jgi:type II secretory pathway component PulF